MFRKRIRRKAVSDGELNITAFMNLMVVLVPFLLITAVFSQVTMLELNLPGGGESPEDVMPPPIELEVTIRKDQLEVGDRNTGLLTVLPQVDGKHDYDKLNEYLQDVKAKFPEILSATILAEETTEYDDIVQAMDAVRLVEQKQDDEWVQAELFPQVSLGNAVPDPRNAAEATP